MYIKNKIHIGGLAMDYPIIDFHTHPYLDQTENYCMFTDDFKLSPTEAAAVPYLTTAVK